MEFLVAFELYFYILVDILGKYWSLLLTYFVKPLECIQNFGKCQSFR